MLSSAYKLIVLFLMFLTVSCDSKEFDEPSSTSTSPAEIKKQKPGDQIHENALSTSEGVSEPVSIAGGFLYCQSQSISEATETISCTIHDDNNQRIEPKNIEIESVVLVYPDTNTKAPSALTIHEENSPWTFTLEAERSARFVEVKALMFGQEQTLETAILPLDDQQIRFEQALMPADQWIHLGDNSSLGGDDCSAEFGTEDLIASGEFYKGLTMEVSLSIQYDSFLKINMTGSCDVNVDGGNSMQFLKIDAGNESVLSETVLVTDGPHSLVEKHIEAGEYLIRINSEFVSGTTRYDEFMFRNLEVLSSNAVSDVQIRFFTP